MEYDDSSSEVISPDHDWTAEGLPEKCLFAFLGDVVHKYAKDNNADMVEELITVSHNIKIYVLHEEKEDICLVQSPVGSASATQVLDTLVNCGCKKVIAVDLLQCHSSYVVCDPKGTIVCECANALLKNGYDIKIFNTINFKKSNHYNPFMYIHSETDSY